MVRWAALGVGLATTIAIVVVLVQRRSDDAPAPTAPVAVTLAERCAASCQAARSCAIMTPTCEQDCIANSLVRACTELAPISCIAAAQCGLRAMCNIPANGDDGCRSTMICQGTTCAANDLACGCRCARDIAPRHVLALLRVDVCAMHCNYDATCIEQRCMVWIQACAISP